MKKPDGGIYLGVRSPSAKGEKPLTLFYKKDRHVLIAGANGTGKTKRLGVPNLLQSQGRSWLVIDPKGALARLTAPARRRFGEVVLLDPFNVAGMGSTGFNPLALLDPASPSFNADAGLIAQALITVDGREMSYWPKAARVLLFEARPRTVNRGSGRGRGLATRFCAPPNRATGFPSPA